MGAVWRRVKYKVVSFSCTHFPLVDQAAADFALDVIRRERPTHIVHHGDLLEAKAASRFPSEDRWTLKEEYLAANRFLADVRKAARRGVELVFLEGNHDKNIRDRGRLSPEIRELCDYRESDHLKELKRWQWFPYVYSSEGVFRLGQTSWAHGYESGVNGDEAQAIRLGIPNGLMVLGHTHRPTHLTRAKKGRLNLPFWHINCGTLRDMGSAHYMERNPRDLWGQGVVVVETDDNPWPPGGERRWRARLELFRMFDQ